MAKRILIIGGTSAIAHETARLFAAEQGYLLLLGRHQPSIEANAADLRVRGASEVAVTNFDANETERHRQVLEDAWERWAGFDVALIAYGTLPDQQACEVSVEATLEAFDTNARSIVALLTDLAQRFESQGHGTLAVISSPAGDRGRASNYVYGAAKAAVTAFASGMRQRFGTSELKVLTIVPGFVDTPMTAAFRKGALWASPARVAKDIHRALGARRGLVVYTPWYWRWISLVLRAVPERWFMRLRL